MSSSSRSYTHFSSHLVAPWEEYEMPTSARSATEYNEFDVDAVNSSSATSRSPKSSVLGSWFSYISCAASACNISKWHNKRSDRYSLTPRPREPSPLDEEALSDRAARKRAEVERAAAASLLDMNSLLDSQPNKCKAAQLEQKYVHQVYEKIAPHVNAKRQVAWPKVKMFLSELPAGSIVADVGSGNGKYAKSNDRIFMVCCDVIPQVLEPIGSSMAQAMLADNLALPFRCNSLDALVCVSVIHHFSTAVRRRRAVMELARCLKPGGRVMLSVWALEQATRQFRAQDVLVPLNLHENIGNNTAREMQPEYRDASCTANKPRRQLPDTTREQRMIEGSVGIRPLDECPTSDRPLSSITTTVSRQLDKLWSLSPAFGRKFNNNNNNSADENNKNNTQNNNNNINNNNNNTQCNNNNINSDKFDSHSTHTDITMASHTALNRSGTDTSYLSAASAGLVDNVSYWSPSLGRKLASLVGVSDATKEDVRMEAFGEDDGVPVDSMSVDHVKVQKPLNPSQQVAVQMWKHTFSASLEQLYPKASNAGFTDDEKIDENDMFPDQPHDQSQAYYRYYHVFRQGELDDLLKSTGCLRILDSYYDHANWCCVAEKMVPVQI